MDPTIIIVTAVGLIAFGVYSLYNHQGPIKFDKNATVGWARFATWVNEIFGRYADSDITLKEKIFTLDEQEKEFEIRRLERKLRKRALKGDKKLQKIAITFGIDLAQIKALNNKALEESFEIQKKMILDNWQRYLDKEKRKDNLEVSAYAKEYVKFELIRLIQQRMDTLVDEITEFAEKQAPGWQRAVAERVKTYEMFRGLKNESEERVYVVGGGDGRGSNANPGNAGYRRPPF